MNRVSPQAQQVRREASIVDGPVWAHAALLILIALALTYPCIRRGMPFGHSVGTHISYQHFFNQEIALGDWYPRWIINMNRGLGSPIFFAQYPLPYYAAWAFGKIVPSHWGAFLETRSLGLALALAAIIAALSTYAWCATFSGRLTAMLAAIVYITLPYFLNVDLYMRAAIGEFWALAILPLSFFFIERMVAGSARAAPGLAVAFALVIVAHLFTAVLLAPVLLVYALWRARPERRMPTAIQTLAGLALATGLAGIYALPFLFHRQFFHPDNFLAVEGANANPLSQMFSYNAATFPSTAGRPGWFHLVAAARVVAVAIAAYAGMVWFRSRGKFRLLLALAAVLVSLQAALAGYVFSTGEVPGAPLLPSNLLQQRGQIFTYTFLTFEVAAMCYWSVRSPRNRNLADFLMALALASYVMMTSWSQAIWKTVHFLWNIQFPWRLNVFLMAAAAGLAALAISDLRKASPRQRLAGTILASGLWGLVSVQSARLGNTSFEFRSMQSYQFEDKMDSVRYIYSQVDPKQALLVQAPDDEKVHVKLAQGSGTAAVTSVKPRSIGLDARCQSDCTLQIGQFYYPAWQVRGAPAGAELHAGSPGGLMELSLPAGEYHLLLELPHGWSERVGGWLSLTSLLVVSFLAITGAPFSSVGVSRPPEYRISSVASV